MDTGKNTRNKLSRDHRIALLGYDEVRRREIEYQRQYRVRHKLEPGQLRPNAMEFLQTLINEGYDRGDAAKISHWLRNDWKRKQFDNTLCRCSDGFTCSVHWLDRMRDLIETGKSLYK